MKLYTEAEMQDALARQREACAQSLELMSCLCFRRVRATPLVAPRVEAAKEHVSPEEYIASLRRPAGSLATGGVPFAPVEPSITVRRQALARIIARARVVFDFDGIDEETGEAFNHLSDALRGEVTR